MNARDGNTAAGGISAASARTTATYNLAACDYDAAYWDRYGRRTVERLGLRAGDCVLDVASGTGASAIPAAEAVGPGGRVVAMDLASNMLDRARVNASVRGLSNLEFRIHDMTALDYADASFDAAVCVFGVFFVEDMKNLVAGLWRVVKPGGALAITTWGPRIFEPMYGRWNEAVARERPDLAQAYRPWERITHPEAVAALLREAGIESVQVEVEAGEQPLAAETDWWKVVLGSGMRWTVDQLGSDAAQRVRLDNLEWIRRNAVRSIETNVIYACARRPV